MDITNDTVYDHAIRRRYIQLVLFSAFRSAVKVVSKEERLSICLYEAICQLLEKHATDGAAAAGIPLNILTWCLEIDVVSEWDIVRVFLFPPSGEGNPDAAQSIHRLAEVLHGRKFGCTKVVE